MKKFLQSVALKVSAKFSSVAALAVATLIALGLANPAHATGGFDYQSIDVGAAATTALTNAASEYGVIMGLILILVVVFALFYFVLGGIRKRR